jgi:uncharacterized protein YhaN
MLARAIERIGGSADLPARGAEAMSAFARIRKLSLEERAIAERARAAGRAETHATAELEERARVLAAMPAPEDLTRLREAIDRARAEGDLGVRLRRAASEASALERRVSAGLVNLGLFRGTADELAALAVPSIETIERWARTWAEAQRVREKASDALTTERVRAADLDREIDAQHRAGHVPTEEELMAARRSRDRAWVDLRAAIGRRRSTKATLPLFETARERAESAQSVLPEPQGRAAQVGEATIDAFEITVRHADDIADRLRREAERVTRVARLSAEQAAIRGRIATLETAARETEERGRGMRAEWASLFEASGIAPEPPEEMARWSRSRAALTAIIEELRAARAELATVERIARDRAADLRRALDAGETASSESVHEIGALVERAGRELGAREAAARAREAAVSAIVSLEAALASRRRDRADAEADLETYKREWGQSVARIGLLPDASPEDATRTIEEIAEASKLGEKRDELARRVRGIDRDSAAFETRVRSLAASHAPDLAAASAEAAAAELARRYQQGKADRAHLIEIERQIEDKTQKGEAAERRALAAEARLAACLRAARSADAQELVHVERRSREARELDAKMMEVEDQLLQAGEGASLEALVAELEGASADGVAVEIEAAKEAQASLEEERRKNDERIGRLDLGVKDYEGRAPKAAEAALAAEEHLARAHDLSMRYARARLAVAILEAEAERYREANQGPILTRGSELVRRLTLGSITVLRTAYDDEDRPVIACVREGDVEVGVEALSDGTRDQLYLALRLATLERYAEANGAFSIVADDILIHFDDDRARAALALLGELAARVQVLFFTHHARMIDLAKGAVPGERLVIHSL